MATGKVPVQGGGPLTDRQREAYVNEMKTALDKMNDEAAVLPEPVFVQHILPLIAGNADGSPVNLDLWTSIAGVTFRGIDVTDPRTGAILFRCPPIQRQLSTSVRGRDDRRAYLSTIPEILGNAENLAKNSPRQARHYMDKSLDGKVPRDPIDMQRAKEFDAILKRYGYPGLNLPANVTGGADTPKDTSNGRLPVKDIGDFDF